MNCNEAPAQQTALGLQTQLQIENESQKKASQPVVLPFSFLMSLHPLLKVKWLRLHWLHCPR